MERRCVEQQERGVWLMSRMKDQPETNPDRQRETNTQQEGRKEGHRRDQGD